MNFTFSSLRLSEISSSLSPLLTHRNTLQRCYFTHQISPIIYSSKSQSIFKTKFSKSLSSAVVIQSENDVTIENIEIKESIFSDLKNSEQGGAVLVKHPQAFVRIYKTLFLGCSATTNGGGLYCTSARLNLSESAFHECSISDMAWSGQAFLTTCNYAQVNTTTVFCCAISETLRGSEAAILVGGVQCISQLNSSYNIAAQYASGLATSESVSFSLKLSQFWHNQSPNHMLALVHIRPDDDISFCNFIKNTVPVDGLFYISGGYCILRKCVFKRNTGTFAVFNQAYGPGYLTIEECEIDLPEQRIMSGQYNLYNVQCVFTKKPSKLALPRNSELNPDNLYRMYRYINIK